jgi:hypothetical protein
VIGEGRDVSKQRRLSTCRVYTMSRPAPPSVVGDLSDERCEKKLLRVDSKNFSLSRLDTPKLKSQVSMMRISLQPLFMLNLCS